MRLAPWNQFKPSSKIFLITVPRRYFFCGSFLFFVCVCLVFLMLSRLFIAALWSPAGKGLTSWLLLVIFIVFLLLYHVVYWVRCGTRLYWFLIFAVFLTLNKKLSFSFLSNRKNIICGHARMCVTHSIIFLTIYFFFLIFRFGRQIVGIPMDIICAPLITQLIHFARECSNVGDFNNMNTFLTAEILYQGYRCSNFYRRHL